MHRVRWEGEKGRRGKKIKRQGQKEEKQRKRGKVYNGRESDLSYS